MITHTGLYSTVMTRIIRYQKGAAHLEDAIISNTLYHCIYFQAKRNMHICVCICDYLYFAKWIWQFNQDSLCRWSLEWGLEREGDVAGLYATSSSLGGQCQDKNRVLGINERESPGWLQPAFPSSCPWLLPCHHYLFAFQMSYLLEIMLLCTVLCVCVCVCVLVCT